MNITIKRIFPNFDLRQTGQEAISKFLRRYKIPRESLDVGELIIFTNRKNNNLRAVSKSLMVAYKFYGNETFDWNLRRSEIFGKLGEDFDQVWIPTESSFRRAKLEVGMVRREKVRNRRERVKQEEKKQQEIST
jgi:hypothetical protein